MKKGKTAKRFAKALVELGMESGAYDQYGKELRTVLPVFKGSPELYRALLNPMYKLPDRKRLTDKISEALKLSPYVGKFLSLLVETRNIRLLEDIVEAYSKLEDELAGRIRATVESAVEPPDALLQEIRQKLKAGTGKDIILAYRLDPSLIGGLVLRIGNTVLDGSVKTQLELMKEKILEGVV